MSREKGDVIGMISIFASASPKLRVFLALLNDQVLTNDQKALAFCQHPLEQMFVSCILNCLGIRARALLSEMEDSARHRIITKFNTRNAPLDRKVDRRRCAGLGD